MAPVQTAYTVDHAAALRGNIANANGRETTSGVAEVAIQPGFPVVRGTADNGVVLPDGTGDSFRGVSVRSLEQEKDSVTGTLDYNITDEVQILRKGEIWVLVNEAVVAGDPVFFVHTGGDIGKFRNDIDTDQADAINGARFIDSGADETLVRIQIPAALEL